MTSSNDGFILLTLSGVTLRSRHSSYFQSGTLTVECISIPLQVQAALNRDIFLILRINSDEVPLDPRRTITLTADAEKQEPGGRTYHFGGTETDPEELELNVLDVGSGAEASQRREDIDTFEGILAGYADFRDSLPTDSSQSAPLTNAPHDLRGHLVLVNEDSGEIIGEVDKSIIPVQQDQALSHPEKGHEQDPVVIEIAEDQDGNAIQVFARTIPADQQDWMTKSAKLVSQGISQTTNLLVNVISSASSQYISRSAPSSRSSSPAVSGPNPNTTQSKALTFITSPRTQSGLAHAHALTAQAVKISGETLAMVDGMISKMTRAKSSARGTSQTSAIASSSSLPPPPYSTTPSSSVNAKPPLPPRLGTIHDKPPLPPRSDKSPAAPLPTRTLSKTAKLILSADLILSTLDESAKQLLEVGGRNATQVVNHQYGAGAAQSTALAAGTAQNIALVYIDLRGMGRKALIKRVGKQYVKSKLGK